MIMLAILLTPTISASMQWSPTATTTASIMSLLALSRFQPRVLAKEVEATHEWTLLGDNDTVAAGMHVRMDLSTGEKWVKLPDDDASKHATDSSSSADKSTNEATTTISSSTQHSGAVSVSVNGDSQVLDDIVDTSDAVDTDDEPAYDFDMMHRTLSQLPEEEQERMQLPEPPDSQHATPQQRLEFERRMKDIWLARQQELKEWEEAFVADLPEILKERIGRIQDYLNHPSTELHRLFRETQQGQSVDDTAKDNDEVTHIVSVLADLEYHLSDIDMTRDFYTLGGWPLLVSLLTENVHTFSPNETISDDEFTDQIYSVQAHAAWALGTAVKNTGEFAPYITEPVRIGSTQTTALDVLSGEIVKVDLLDAKDPRGVKYLYALGSFLRGNRAAQRHFAAIHGVKVLGNTLVPAIDGVLVHNDKHSKKVTARLLSLADDIVTGVELHAGPSPQVDMAIIEAFSDQDWCLSIHRALQSQFKDLQETALRTAGGLSKHCEKSWTKENVVQVLHQLKQSWSDKASDEDPDVRQERIQLVESVLNGLS